MSERVDRKLQDVVVGRFEYRHEAEFAAGFLDDAGIPYRLQVDDPVLGMTIAAPATLWVRGVDERRARELLEPGADPTDFEELAVEVEVDETSLPDELTVTSDGDSAATAPRPVPSPRRALFYAPAEQPRLEVPFAAEAARIRDGGAVQRFDTVGHGVEPSDERRRGRVVAGRLSPLERSIALLLCGGAVWMGVGLLGTPSGGLWALALGALGLPMGIGAVAGRTVPPFARLLRALSGSAP